MKAANALIAWTSAGDQQGSVPPGSVAIGPYPEEGEGDWTDGYPYTWRAAEVAGPSHSRAKQEHEVLRDFYRLVYLYGVHPYVAHRAMLHIDEYQDITKEMGAGPDKGELGHDPNVGYGRSTRYPVPKVVERRIGASVHVWPGDFLG